ncbi:MAG: malate dehydrogenase, partial [Leadbetterella sp.]|nr:malate dehydrogenase [Leadbetterella sp.]
MKVTVIGAGAVGATAADNIARKQIASEVVILDIKEGFAEGKAMDLAQTASIEGFDTKLVGVTNDYQRTAKSDVIVVTSGLPRKPGMTREELIGINAGIVRTVVTNALAVSPKAIILIVSNPMDTMTYLTYQIAAEMGISKRKVI